MHRLRLVGGIDDDGRQPPHHIPRPDNHAATQIGYLFLAFQRQAWIIAGMSAALPHLAGAQESVRQDSAPVGRLIAVDLDRWENDRRRKNGRDVRADRIRLDGIVAGCGWVMLEDSGAHRFMDFLAEMRSRKQTRPTKDAPGTKPWKGATMNKAKSLVSTLLADAIMRDPARGLTNWARAIPNAATDDSDEGSRPFMWDEFIRLCEWLIKHAPDRLDKCMVMGYTGIRRGEGAGLMVSEVQLSGSPAIHLTRRTKKRKRRTIPINADILPIMRRVVGDRTSGEIFDTWPTYKTLKRDCERAGVDPTDVGFHSFRKCFAGRCATQGIPLSVAAKLLGHDDPRLTHNLYTRFQDAELAQHVARLGEATYPQSAISEAKILDKSDALTDDLGVQTEKAMHTLISPSRSAAPSRSIGLSLSEQRGSSALRPGATDRDSAPAPAGGVGHLSSAVERCFRNPLPSGDPASGEALARLLESLADVIRATSAPRQSGGAA